MERGIKLTLKAARVNVGLTQTEVGKKLGKSKSTIIAWENGKREIDIANFDSLCRLYGVKRDDIILPF